VVPKQDNGCPNGVLDGLTNREHDLAVSLELVCMSELKVVSTYLFPIVHLPLLYFVPFFALLILFNSLHFIYMPLKLCFT
jgi:hypothetical protein